MDLRRGSRDPEHGIAPGTRWEDVPDEARDRYWARVAEAGGEVVDIDERAVGRTAEVVPAAYFMNPHVQQLIGYAGQTPRPIDPHPDYLDDGLLDSVISRGPIYRPTPAAEGG